MSSTTQGADSITGYLLDAAVAKAEGLTVVQAPDGYSGTWVAAPLREGLVPYSPSTEWAVGGPIIERMLPCDVFSVARDYGRSADWYCGIWLNKERVVYEGPTPLVAAMRAYVASKLGEDWQNN